MPISSVITGKKLKELLAEDIQDDEEICSFQMSITAIVDARMGLSMNRTISLGPAKPGKKPDETLGIHRRFFRSD